MSDPWPGDKSEESVVADDAERDGDAPLQEDSVAEPEAPEEAEEPEAEEEAEEPEDEESFLEHGQGGTCQLADTLEVGHARKLHARLDHDRAETGKS